MTPLALHEPYRTRTIRCTGVIVTEGWRLKVYEAAYDRDRPRPELVEGAMRLARHLPQPAARDGRYGVGFLCAHDGRGGCYAFVDWWADENELHHLIFTSPEDRPADLRRVPPDGLTACVWDLAIIAFEREAWLDAVLANPEGPDLERYLDTRLSGDV